jgi:hypothetical protein
MKKFGDIKRKRIWEKDIEKNKEIDELNYD